MGRVCAWLQRKGGPFAPLGFVAQLLDRVDVPLGGRPGLVGLLARSLHGLTNIVRTVRGALSGTGEQVHEVDQPGRLTLRLIELAVHAGERVRDFLRLDRVRRSF